MTSVRGRTSREEVRRELDGLYGLSRGRARDGFTPSETALGVFTLKEAVYELVAYSAARAQIIADQAAAMLELSTPVVRLRAA